MNSTMKYKGFQARIEYSAEDEAFVGHIAGINDVIGFHAETVPDLKAAFEEAVNDYVETCVKVGKSPERPFSGNLMLRVDPAVHAGASIAAQLSGKTLNQWVEGVLRAAAGPQPA